SLGAARGDNLSSRHHLDNDLARRCLGGISHERVELLSARESPKSEAVERDLGQLVLGATERNLGEDALPFEVHRNQEMKGSLAGQTGLEDKPLGRRGVWPALGLVPGNPDSHRGRFLGRNLDFGRIWRTYLKSWVIDLERGEIDLLGSVWCRGARINLHSDRRERLAGRDRGNRGLWQAHRERSFKARLSSPRAVLRRVLVELGGLLLFMEVMALMAIVLGQPGPVRQGSALAVLPGRTGVEAEQEGRCDPADSIVTVQLAALVHHLAQLVIDQCSDLGETRPVLSQVRGVRGFVLTRRSVQRIDFPVSS